MDFCVDIGTAILGLILGHLFSGILGVVYMTRRRRDVPVGAFLLSRLFEMLAWVLIGLRGSIPDILSISVGNSCLIAGSALKIVGFLKLGHGYKPWMQWSYLAATPVLIGAFNLTAVWWPFENIRIAAMSVLLTLAWLPPLYRMLGDRQASALQRVVAITYAAALMLLIVRGYAGLTFGDEMTLLSRNPYNALLFGGLYMIMLVGNLGFILMSKEASDDRLMYAATYDELTGILNRRTFAARAKEAIALCARKREPLAFIIMDIDRFKRINDAHGHLTGDRVLRSFADAMAAQLRPYDLFGRIGGEEFAVLLPDVDEAGALEVAQRMRAAAAADLVDETVSYTVSIGLTAQIPDEHTSLDALYKQGDAALYRAKEAGRNRVEAAKAGAEAAIGGLQGRP